MSQNKTLLIIAAILIVLGLLKPDLSSVWKIGSITHPVSNTETYVIDAPTDEALLEKAQSVIKILSASNDSTKKFDCLKLSSLYSDIATLIELDNEDMVIKDTATIKEANGLCGNMLRLNIKDKYPDLAEASRAVIVAAIGDDDVLLDENYRNKAAEAFRSLSWAFYEGSK